MKKVVHLITLLEFGGAQGNTIHTVKNLNPANFEAHLWCGPGAYWDAEMRRLLEPENRIRFFPRLLRHVHPLNDILVLFDLFKALKKLRPDVLHTHSSKAGILGRLAGKWAGVPLVVHTFHGFGFNDQQSWWVKWFYVRLEKWAARWAHQLIFVSEANVQTAAHLKIGRPSQYRLIRSGVPIEEIKKKGAETNPEKVKKSLNIPTGHRVVTSLSAFKPQKNLKDFIEVAALVRKMNPEISFVLLGDGEMRGGLEKEIEARGLVESLRLPGWRKDAAEILAASDLFVLTSLWEGLPRALVEAMVLGKPSVCYDTDGVADLLKQGGGRMVPQHDTDGMASQISTLLSDKTLWNSLSKQAKDLISMDFDIDEMVRIQERLYLGLLPR